MNPIDNVNGTAAAAGAVQKQGARDLGPGQIEYQHPADQLEISEMGIMLSKLRELPDVRLDRVTRIRAEIEAGTFETPARIEGTVDRMLEELS